MPVFRKKPVMIEAIQLVKRMDICTPDWWAEAIQTNAVTLRGFGKYICDVLSVDIKTLEGVMQGKEGDWVIQGVAGELYPCKQDIFALTYEKVGE